LAKKINNQAEATNSNITAKKPHYSFQILPVCSQYVDALLKNMDIKKVTSFDQTPAKLIVTSAHILSIPLTHIINKSFQSGVFPGTLKIAKVKPLHKKGITTDCIGLFRFFQLILAKL